jgi:type VI secretion system protein ImpH
METPGGRQGPSVEETLFETPFRFDFFQAVRLLERIARERARKDGAPAPAPIGRDGRPEEEFVRFRALQSHAFPASSVVDLKRTETQDGRQAAAEMTVSFMGLTGSNGALPHHYTTTMITQRNKALGEFFDLFNHRTISLFYRAWEKHQFPIAYEQSNISRDENRPAQIDPFTRALYCLVGLGTKGVRNRLLVDDEAILLYAGHFARLPRSAISLQLVLSDYFSRPVEVIQFRGQWLHLPPEEQSMMPNRANSLGLNCALGVSTIVGSRIWSIENSFRVRLGPLDYQTFAQFQPGSAGLRTLCQLVRLYVGMQFDFDVQPVLHRDEIPPSRLGGDKSLASRLGLNTWLPQPNRRRHADDAVFRDEGLPSRN